MDVFQPDDGLYMFCSYLAPIDLAFCQYLLAGPEPLLVHTGNVSQAAQLVPKLKEILAGQPLRYVFVSHFESDECGGLALILEHFPDCEPVCSQVTARQLQGFGLPGKPVIKSPGDRLLARDFELEFISYPSEAHLWEGLLAFETGRRLLFSSDLFIRRGPVRETATGVNWSAAIDQIASEQVPHPEALDRLRGTLRGLPVRLVAPGHGPVLSVE